MERLTPAQRQILAAVDEVKRVGWGQVIVDVENGLVRHVTPCPHRRAERDVDIREEKCYTIPNS